MNDEIEKQFYAGLGKEVPIKKEKPLEELTWKEIYERHLNPSDNHFVIKIIDNIYLGSNLDVRKFLYDDEWDLVSMIHGEDEELNFPIDDFGFVKNYLQQFQKAIDTLVKLSQGPKNVFVHCAAGTNRSPSTIIGYILKKYKVSLEDALEYFKGKRIINPCPKHLVEACLYAGVPIDLDFIIQFSSLYGWDKNYPQIPKPTSVNEYRDYIYQVVELEHKSWMD